MNSIIQILNQYTAISLNEVNNTSQLLDRTDKKYTFHINQLPEILNSIKEHYGALNVDTHKISRYKTLYYDTAEFDLYNKHQCGKLNRYKIRHRSYLENKLGFLEVKFKNNKGRTVKTRIKQDETTDIHNEKSLLFLQKILPFNPNELLPKIWINYSRITLVNKTSAERVTIDVNLEFQSGEQKKLFDRLVIAEVKQEKKFTSPFVSVMHQHRINEGSISKYCFGVANMFPGIKKNNFKDKLLTLEKITKYDPTSIG